MFGLGTLINVIAILSGGLVGMLAGRMIPERMRESLIKASGVAVIFIGAVDVVSGMLKIQGSAHVSQHSLFLVICLVLGTVLGELINFEGAFERFGEWLKRNTGNAKDNEFVNAFLTASFTVCIGAMAIVGSIQDGLHGDISTLVTKSILDFVTILVMTGSLGKGCIFSAIPVFVLQGLVTFLARLIQPIMTEKALENISLIGASLIFCVGINLVFGKKIKVANMLPSLIVAVAAAFLPFEL